MVSSNEISDNISLSEQCISRIKDWMDQNKLKMNESKTEFIILSKPSSWKEIEKTINFSKEM